MNSPARRTEAEWLDLIRKRFPRRGAPVGMGDDGAVLENTGKTCVTTDLLIEGVDFISHWAPPEAVGWKALAVNLSDLASMGAAPRQFLLSLGIPRGCPDGRVEAVIAGMAALARRERVELVGGDLSRSPGKLVISITAIGTLDGEPMKREGSAPGDSIWVAAPLGGPAAALAAFRKGARLEEFPLSGKVSAENALLDRFFRPPGQARAARFLSGSGAASSAIDVSDGLLLDLSRLLGKRKGAVVNLQAIPRFGTAGAAAGDSEVLRGGEEQTLLFTVPPSKERLLASSGLGFYKIGTVVPGSGILIEDRGRTKKAYAGGFDHFRKS